MADENRLDRLGSVLSSAGEFLLQTSELAQQNTVAIDRLVSASERHDRILDYLLSQQQT